MSDSKETSLYPWFFRLFLMLLCSHLLFLGAYWVFDPLSPIVNTSVREGRSWYDITRILFLRDTHRLSGSRPGKVLVLGGSMVVRGFPLDELQKLCPRGEVHMMGLNGSNLRENREQLEYVESQIVPGSLQGATIVLGIYCGQFVSRDVASLSVETPSTPTSPLIKMQEALFPRYVFEKLSPKEKGTWIRWYLNCISPPSLLCFEMGEKINFVKRDSFHVLKAILFGNQEFNHSLSNSQESHPKEFSPNGTFSEDQFIDLEMFCNHAKRLGANTLLVDLPVPTNVHTLPLYRQYRKALASSLPILLQIGGVSYFDLQERLPDCSFQDSIHPTKSSARRWCQELSLLVQPLPLTQ